MSKNEAAPIWNKIFGEKKTVKQIIREQKRINNRSIREIARELNKIKKEEQKNQIEMKRLAKQGQMTAVRHLAKDIVRMRQTQTNFIKLKSELQSLSHSMDAMQANKQLVQSMKNVSKIMPVINKQIKLPELTRVLRQFDEETTKQQLKQELIDDAMNDVLDNDEDAEDELVSRVLDEIGIEMDSNLQNAPGKALPQKQQDIEDEVDKDLQQRLNALK
mmetsp:Transcript_23402/g.37452  ORF Transcript_23402/g.37452 Transcript_23402/m.37452 type:complete len:218 (+) Transcript_23402:35-688(+)|eukprot:CAMPEP_0202690016 /NCGR_PEP_ID=MMETSP1385-20130828/5165_1 /ASSEMBLY_ACC=CAM_ASM_000861 /TAXON_ID=933848 /ORGANISM="Elphidium margaritaceum" /LENGTH=217 /DNA_ID=CAMNT_0049345243 /DNA_START=24 /DNA_END=677 /DNA_ORIENTATION=-